ncbi:MAG: DUF423 domain-containing protein [Verrucomicrobia bacterium]|nr:DUF423 domain-containing protein [Verrucomicrobiota bacterium]
MNSPEKGIGSLLVAAGVLGVTGVALGAMGAHALAAKLAERGTAASWDTAAKYHLLHTVAVFAVALWLRQAPERAEAVDRHLRWAARCWTIGVVLFSGSIYCLALGGPRWLGPVTPLGGMAFLIGWGLVAAAGLRRA